jgi:hypothetical protein
MKYYPTNDFEFKELNDLEAKEWQIDCLKLNPNYNSWGNDEGYMSDENGQWSSPIQLDSVSELFELDDLNELINFYFNIENNGYGALLGLQMWFIHPRKGASRGVYLKEIREDEVKIVIDYLKEARNRNYERFSKL